MYLVVTVNLSHLSCEIFDEEFLSTGIVSNRTS